MGTGRRILFVCWGNICRSPTAEGIMRRAVDRAGLTHVVEVDSAGTSSEHAGQPPDRRAVTEARARGIDLTDQRARKVRPSDWDDFDLILVADTMVEHQLERLAPPGPHRATVARMTAFGPDADLVEEVPDPYYGGPDGFQRVYDLLERACDGLLADLRAGLEAEERQREPRRHDVDEGSA